VVGTPDRCGFVQRKYIVRLGPPGQKFLATPLAPHIRFGVY